MFKFLAILGMGLVALAQSCVSPPPPERAVLGDSEAYIVAQQLGVDNASYAEGTCALGYPDAQRVLIHAGGHSTVVWPFGYYDEATWQACLLGIIDHYGASNTYVATAPQPLAIYCASYFDEYDQRLSRANDWKIRELPKLRPGVHIVRWDDLHVGSDCTHFAGDETIAAQRAVEAGF